ncbi:transcription factor coe2-B [Acrasis kona]|uniref:Transcription factor coe2-B n=1 Tax=Acrasis kona TaxID=1008807 RepID=A0AAW2YWF5_9EUKA
MNLATTLFLPLTRGDDYSNYVTPIAQQKATQEDCSVRIVDGTRKQRYGTNYWVQRNVITIQVSSNSQFEEARIFCNRKGTTDPKHMETICYMETNAKRLNSSFEVTFKKKLPYTSGRPETQKQIWLSAEFWSKGVMVKRCNSEAFFVCSRPGTDKSPPSSPEQVIPSSPVSPFKVNIQSSPVRRNSPDPQVNNIPLPSTSTEPRTTCIQPQLVSILPSSGSYIGGCEATITIRNYTLLANDQVSIYFGLIPVTNIEIVGENTVVATTPARFMPGTVSVSIVINGNEIKNNIEYRYISELVPSTSTQPYHSYGNVRHDAFEDYQQHKRIKLM